MPLRRAPGDILDTFPFLFARPPQKMMVPLLLSTRLLSLSRNFFCGPAYAQRILTLFFFLEMVFARDAPPLPHFFLHAFPSLFSLATVNLWRPIFPISIACLLLAFSLVYLLPYFLPLGPRCLFRTAFR